MLYTIRYYTDKWTSHGGTRVEYPHFYYEDFEYIEVPNEEVREALEIWASFRNVTNFNDGANISISHLLQMMFYYCDAYGLEYPYVDASTKWVQREALLEFGAYFFGITQEDLDQQVKMRPLYYDAQRDAYCDLNYDYSYQFAEINATEKMGLIRYTEMRTAPSPWRWSPNPWTAGRATATTPLCLQLISTPGTRCSARRSSPT